LAKRFELKIPNWDEYQERPDRSNYVWFKFHQKILTGDFWSKSTLAQKAMFVTLLCLRNAQQEETIRTVDFVLAGHAGIKTNEVEETLKGLITLGVVQDVSGTIPGQTQDVHRQKTGLELELEKNKRREEKKGAGNPLPPVLASLEFSSKARQLLSTVRPELLSGWCETYPAPDYLLLEANKAANWIITNPKKAPKNFGAFFNSWLQRSWDAYRKTIPSNKPTSGVSQEWLASKKGGAA
jgi:hypothetical protein